MLIFKNSGYTGTDYARMTVDRYDQTLLITVSGPVDENGESNSNSIVLNFDQVQFLYEQLNTMIYRYSVPEPLYSGEL
jgi:hypothetical protein